MKLSINFLFVFLSMLGNLVYANSVELPVNNSTSLAPSKIHEACFLMQQQQQIEFSFESTDPLYFNIHYHTQDAVIYPIADQMTPTFKPTVFTAPVDQTYCLMWTNKQNSGVSLSYRIVKR